MHITEVRYTLGYTYNLGDYTNIRPEITLTANVESNEDANEALSHLYQTARHYCHSAIDSALESEGKPAEFSSEPRFVAYRCYDEHVTVIVPVDCAKSFEKENPLWRLSEGGSYKEGYRYAHLWKVLQEDWRKNDYRILDIKQDDIPEIERVFSLRIHNLLFFGRGKMEEILPRYLRQQRGRIEKPQIREYRSFHQEQIAEAAAQNLILLPVSDSADWETLPEVRKLFDDWQATQNRSAIEDGIPFEDDDDYDEDEDE